MGIPVSQVKIYIDGPFGNFQLKRVKSYDITDEQDAETVMAVGVDGGAGTRFKTGGGEITFEVFREQDTPEVNWKAVQRQRLVFSLTFQDVAGLREQYQGCVVAQTPRKGDEQASHMDSIKIKFLKYQSLPPQA